MKPKLNLLFTGITLCMLIQSSVSFAAEDPRETKKTRVSSSRNNSSVKIYPDIVKRVMHVVAKDNEGTGIDFFVFDLEGTIIKHYKMQSGEHQKLNGLERGTYIFSVFSGDEETATGNIEIR